MPFMRTITGPRDLKRLTPTQVRQLAEEIRAYLIDSVSRTGGHLGPNLGVVELTIALHYVFETPHDRIVWDVGHQTYSHKILTGRRERMGSLRQKDGLAAFPRRSESEYDTFGVGHSSTSISAALGMAIAALRGSKRLSKPVSSTPRPKRRPVAGMNCISPAAPARELACTRPLDSLAMMPNSSASGRPRFSHSGHITARRFC